jgi:hypothetical protein
VKGYDEIRMAEKRGYDGWDLAEDLLGLLLCVGLMLLILFLMGGM